MGKSIFERGVVNTRNISHWFRELEKSLEFIFSVSYLRMPLDENSNILFGRSWDDLIFLDSLREEIDEYIAIDGSDINGYFGNDLAFFQTMELIYNIIIITNQIDHIQDKKTEKAREFIRVMSIVKSIVECMGYEFIPLESAEKQKFLSNLDIMELFEYDDYIFYKLVQKLNTNKKEIIGSTKYANLIEEYNTKITISLERKREILNLLSEIVDGKAPIVKKVLGGKVSNTIFTVLNNYNVRHDNINPQSKNFNPDFINLSEEDIEKKYDEVMKLIIAFWVVGE